MTATLYLSGKRLPFCPMQIVRAANDTPALSPTSCRAGNLGEAVTIDASPAFSAPFHEADNV